MSSLGGDGCGVVVTIVVTKPVGGIYRLFIEKMTYCRKGLYARAVQYIYIATFFLLFKGTGFHAPHSSFLITSLC